LADAQREAESLRLRAEAERFQKEQEAEGVKKLGLAQAEAIRAKAVAEAEGIDKKAEAMRKYGEAAVLEMYFAALPEIARNVAEPLSKVDKITMYGEGNSAKLVRDIIQSTTQISEGFMDSIGIDLKGLLAGFVGGRVGASAQPAAPVAPAMSAESAAPAVSASPAASDREEKGKK
jgi:flotillin